MEEASALYLKEKLISYDKIVIYGAGLYGELFLKKMYDLRIYKKMVFAVTGAPQEKEVLGHEVFDIASFENSKDNYIVVIAVGPRLNLELKDNLEKLNISSYLELDGKLRNYLKTEPKGEVGDNSEAMELTQEIYHKLLYIETRLSKLEQNLVMENENSLKLDKLYRLFLEKSDE